MNEHTQAWAYDKLWHACQNALFVIDHLLTNCVPSDKQRLERVAEELRAALEYHEGIDERLKP